MNFEHRLQRRRELALIEARSLVAMYQVGPDTLTELESQIEQRRLTLSTPIAEVQQLMSIHSISLEEVLDFGAGTSDRVTHRHPITGEEWHGVGPQPQWLRNALLVEGYRPSDLRVADAIDRPAGS